MTIITERINEYIDLKLENNTIKVLVNGEEFKQCVGLIIYMRWGQLKTINSVDEAGEMSPSIPQSSFEISPRAQFFGHCRNLKKWVDSGYDSRLLHSNLSFPLLRKLSEVRDSKAMRAFNEEIVKRFSSGVSSVQTFLLQEGYLDFLGKDEVEVLLNNINNVMEFRGSNIPLYEAIALMDLENLTSTKFVKVNELDFDFSYKEVSSQYIYNEKGKKIEALLFRDIKYCEECREDYRHNCEPPPTQEECDTCGIYKLPDSVGDFSFLRELYVFSDKYHGFKEIPQTLFKLKSLEKLVLVGNRINSIPDSIANCKQLRHLEVSASKLNTIPESIGNIQGLSTVKFRACELNEIPESITDLSELTSIDLSSNKIKYLPESFGNLQKLEEISISSNLLVEIPESFRELKKLESLDVSLNRIKVIPEWIENLESLIRFDFSCNPAKHTMSELNALLSKEFSEIEEEPK